METKFVETVLMVVGLGVLILLIVFAAPRLLHAHEKYDCASQVKLSGAFSTGTKGHLATSIKCPSGDYVIGDESDEEVKAFIAEKMKDCWDTWDQGNSLLFDDNGIYCHVCDYMTFEQKSGEVAGLHKYLWETEVPGTGMNYVTYLAPGRKGERYASFPTPAELNQQQMAGPAIDKSKGYAVIFYYLRGDKQIDVLVTKLSENTLLRAEGAAKGGGIGIVTGGFVGAALFGATVCTIVSGGTCALLIGGVAAIGGVGGGLIGMFVKEHPPNYASFIIFRELSTDELAQLGCEYAPVSE